MKKKYAIITLYGSKEIEADNADEVENYILSHYHEPLIIRYIELSSNTTNQTNSDN